MIKVPRASDRRSLALWLNRGNIVPQISRERFRAFAVDLTAITSTAEGEGARDHMMQQTLENACPQDQRLAELVELRFCQRSTPTKRK